MNPMSARAERLKKGKALREATPREAHAELQVSRDRDLVAILEAEDPQRLPELVSERYKRMTVDAFAFLRGAAAVMAADLEHQPMAGVPVQACGDCHLMNFGAVNTPEDNIIFDINDFDETLPGVDFTIDVKRLAASVAVAAGHAGMSKKRAHALATSTVASYRKSMFELIKLSPLEIWHARVDLQQEAKSVENRQLQRKLTAIIRKARGIGLATDDNFPHLVDGNEPKIADKPPTIFHLDPNADARHALNATHVFEAYRRGLAPERLTLFERYQIKDLAFKAVGVGSVGTFCCIGLFLSGDNEPLFLQLKETQRSVLERLSPSSTYQGPQGRRVIEGQRMMQAATDTFLGWTEDRTSGRQFYVRTLKNRHLGSISEIAEAEALSEYARLCGRTLARAHARSGDPAVIAGYMGKGGAFDDAIAAFASAYADQTVIDHAALTKAKATPPNAKSQTEHKARTN